MNISDNSYSNYNTGITGGNIGIGGRNDAVSNGQGALSGNAQITQVKAGQLFNGRIIDITNNQISIMLDGNKTLFAHMAEAVNLNIGDALTFMVKENNGANVVIKPFMAQADTMKDSAIFKVLDSNGFMPTAKNYQIAEALMNNNMPVDKAGMQRIMQQAYKFPDTPIETLVALNKLGMSVNEANISQYEAYVSNSHQIMNDLMNMGNAVSEFSASEIGMMSDKAEILSFSDKLLAVFSDMEDAASFNQTDMMSGGLTGAMPEAESTGALTGKALMSEEALKQVFKSLIDMGFDAETVNNMLDRSETPLQFLNNLNRLMDANGSLNDFFDAKEVKALLMSDGYRELLSGAVRSKLMLDGSDMKEPKELDGLYNRIYDKTNKLLEAFSGNNSNAGQSMSESAKGMQERMDFIQNLNNMYAYAQIPVRVSGDDMNSELFVYMNKRNMKEAKEDVSALLHLDMEHLGATDVHVSLHGTSVHTRFYVEDETSARIIDEHMNMLEKAINENGYSLTNEVITREPSLNTTGNMVVDEMLGKDLEQSVKRYSFDVRM